MSSQGSRRSALWSCGDGQLSRFRGIEQRSEQPGILRRGKDGVMQPLAPFPDPPFHALRPDDRAAIGQVHVLFQIPAQVFEIVLVEERRERCGNANAVPRNVLEMKVERSLLNGSEQQAKFLHRRADR